MQVKCMYNICIRYYVNCMYISKDIWYNMIKVWYWNYTVFSLFFDVNDNSAEFFGQKLGGWRYPILSMICTFDN